MSSFRRPPPRNAVRGGTFLLAATLAPQLAHACATCGCTLSTDAATGYSTASGWRINVDYTYIDQNQLQLQINVFHRSADQGAFADAPDTAGTVAYLSPGISASLTRNLQLYAFVQLPVYSQLQGYQLFLHWTGTVGLNMKL